MKLKRLDIHGFKSFYHRTTVVFDDGITAVVGPNGCGKSNIVDSLKWVMGEQGAKALRGGSMEDVIFNGTGQRGPMGMCEVRLTYVNDGSAEVPARWKDVTEIAIERRMERTGGSDYFINKVRVRLSDVHDLLAGTGVGGQRAYAIIEQGQIGRIVSARPEERRSLIEEAAGITRYRQRKKVAERKMEETRLNLERVADIIGEVDGQLKSLRRQAKKAERYKEYRTEARQLQLKAAVWEFQKLQGDHAALIQRVEALAGGEGDAIRTLEAAEAHRAAVKLEEQGTESRARALAGQLAAAENEVRLAEGQIELLGREAAVTRQRLESARVERGRAAERIAELDLEQREAEARAGALAEEAVGEASDLPLLEVALQTAQSDVKAAREAAEANKRAAAEAAQTIIRARTVRDAAARREQELLARAVAAQDEVESLLSQREVLSRQLREAQERLRAAEEQVESARTDRESAEADRLAAEALARAAEETERRAREQLAGTRSRLRSLEELEARREGVGEGPRAVLARGAEAGVLGLVTENLSPPAELEKAVAAALDTRLQAVVVTDLDRAAAAAGLLRAQGRGRGAFVAADARAQPVPPPPEAPGVRGRLIDLLDARGLAAVLLDDALLVDDLPTALDLARAGRWAGCMVTPEGDRVDGAAWVTGGHGGADAAPLSRRREIRELSASAERLEAESTQARDAAAAHRLAAAEARTRRETAARALQDGEIRRAEARKDAARFEADLQRATQRSAQIADDLADLRTDAREAAEQVRKHDRELAAVDAGTDERQKAILAAERSVAEAEVRRDGALTTLHEARTRQVARQERLTAARDRVTRLAAQRREATERVSRMVDEMESTDLRLGELAHETKQAEARLTTLRQGAAVRASALAEARAEHETAIARVEAAEQSLVEGRRLREQARDALADARLALQERQLRLQNLEERVERTFRLRMDEAAAELHGADDPPTADDLARLQEIEALIERMGEVNLAAIEECAEVEKRYDFLTAQQADLNAALDDLEKAIDQINRTSRQLFRETFEAVNERFKAIFPRMFRGGVAELALTDPDDMLETGVEMLVQPPGKKVGNVGLLSGGEKAMCAIALIFAVFQVKPSPFCLLDEVDAPLDDANIGRFNEVVRDIAQMSQVVLITHNKRTMEIADVLYGITMEEPGISKLVSVRMA
ncbi:chromosome segregation protein SMC [Myxococcota bacterium]|nr:chromosome segregation protein SMC [Myxococcota bacterium]